MKKLLFLSLATLGFLGSSCNDEDPPLPSNTINFSSSQLGIDESETSKTFTISIDRATTTDVTAVLSVTESDVTYEQDYTTTPVVATSTITVTIPAGQTSTSVTVQKTTGALFDGDETITLALASVSDGIVAGSTTSISITFGSIISNGSELTLNGGEGGSLAANSVYVDFSNNEQTSVARKSWNLAFYCGETFAVKLNNTTGSTAMQVDIDVDDVVNSTDSAGYATALTLTATVEGSALVDDWSADLSKTVIQEGKVYVLNLGESQTPLYKVKVSSKDADTYTLQYAKIDESSVSSIDVLKDSKQNFVYVSFAENGIVSVEPAKAKWDIVWTRSVYKTTSGGVVVPYTFSDLILINEKASVKAAEIVSADAEVNQVAYAGFTLANADTLTFNTSIDAIGSKWRNGGGPNVSPYSKADRFYVVKDAGGSFYKIQFISIGDVRGYPKLKYELLK
jgi:hypothetical protein